MRRLGSCSLTPGYDLKQIKLFLVHGNPGLNLKMKKEDIYRIKCIIRKAESG
jgi:hypothetical protein